MVHGVYHHSSSLHPAPRRALAQDLDDPPRWQRPRCGCAAAGRARWRPRRHVTHTSNAAIYRGNIRGIHSQRCGCRGCSALCSCRPTLAQQQQACIVVCIHRNARESAPSQAERSAIIRVSSRASSCLPAVPRHYRRLVRVLVEEQELRIMGETLLLLPHAHVPASYRGSTAERVILNLRLQLGMHFETVFL